MNLKQHEPILINLLSGLIIGVIILIIVPLNNFELIEIILKLEIKDLIAVLVIGAFIMGTSFILGFNLKESQDYHFKNFKVSTKYQILIFGGMYILYIIYIISAIYYDNRVILFLLIPLVLILQGYFLTVKYETVTLKMVTFNEQGSKKIETRNELELYDTTDKDYRFKDSKGNEFIIPNNQVLEIYSGECKGEESPIKKIEGKD